MNQCSPVDAATAQDLALTHALLQRTETGGLTHCPLMLSPTPISDTLLIQIEAVAQPLALLMHRVANNLDFLAEQLQSTAASDEYTGFLLSLALQEKRDTDALRFSITRSDYFFTAQQQGLRQVEFNTIAASYMGLSEKISEFHRVWGNICQETWDLVPNQPITEIAAAFATAVEEYGVANACILFVVQANERNIFDQRLIENALALKGIRVIRTNLAQIGEQGKLRDGHLVLNDQIAAVTYFRAGYRPDELASHTARQGYRLIAQSNTISVPDIPTHLAGTKKIQQVLTDPAVLKLFLEPSEIDLVQQVFAKIYALDELIEVDGKQMLASDTAIAHPEKFVLKPQREGGGFNVYGAAIRECLTTTPAAEFDQYILMERLYPPVSEGIGLAKGEIWQGEVVSEIGQYGVLIARGEQIITNQGAGYLVRTKLHGTDEGGISSGYGYLNSLVKVK